jgi:ribosomal protein L20A (L18A)
MAAGINKIDDGWHREQIAIAERQNREHIAKYDRSFNGIMAKSLAEADADGDEIDREDDGGGASDHHASKVADLLVEAGTHPDRSAALSYLLHSPHGAALLSRLSKRNPPMDTVYDIMKAGSIAGFCAAVVAKGRTSISQDDLVSAVGKIARELRWPELSEAQAFAKVYSDQGAEGRVLRSAINVAKASLAETMLGPGLPVQVVGGPAAQDVDNATEAEQARAELMRIGRKQWPRLTEQAAYEQAFSDPRNATIVARLYQRPTPTSIYPLPNEWLRGEGSQHAKADRGTAYGELMAKAEEYRNAHPALSIAQAFEKVFTAPANRELAKRERVENASFGNFSE